jgi:hypothetical protein
MCSVVQHYVHLGVLEEESELAAVNARHRGRYSRGERCTMEVSAASILRKSRSISGH